MAFNWQDWLFFPTPNDLLLFFIGTFVSLFSIVDPLMALPVFAMVTHGQSEQEKRVLAKRAALYVMMILLIFLISGNLILKFFGISINALRISGGLMILSSAYGMLNQKSRLLPEEEKEAGEKEDSAFSPLAMPLLSGPGAIAVIIGLTTDAKTLYHDLVIVLVIAVVSYLCYLTMRVSTQIMQRMSPTTVNAFTRIMGFILLCVGVQYVVNGITPILVDVFHPKH